MSRPTPGGALLHPVAVAALGLMVLNDHGLKQAYPGMLTGKLSDLAGMVFFPLVLISVWEWGQSLRGGPAVAGRGVVGAAVALTGVSFAAIQLWEPAGDLWSWGLGGLQSPFVGGAWRPVAHTADPTDLLALPALAVPAWIATARRARWNR